MAEKRKDSQRRNLEKGEGQRKDGRYFYRWLDESTGKYRYIYNRNLEELRIQEKSIKRDLDDGIAAGEAQRKTLNQQIEEYFEVKEYELRPTTVSTYRCLYKKHIENSMLGKSKLSDIKVSKVRRFLSNLKKDGMAHKSVALIHALISAALKMAVDDDIIRKNYAKGALDKPKEKQKERGYLKVSQIENVIDFCRGNEEFQHIVPWFIILTETGLRAGECMGLQWDDVNLKEKQLSVNKQVRYYRDVNEEHSKFHLLPPKSQKGNRIIPLTKSACDAFKELREMQFKMGLRCNVNIEGLNRFVFVNSNGRPLTLILMNYMLKRVRAKYNQMEEKNAEKERRKPDLLPEITCHVLRHSCLTKLSQKGINPKTLQALAGHEKIELTMNLYVHEDTEHMAEEMERIKNIV